MNDKNLTKRAAVFSILAFLLLLYGIVFYAPFKQQIEQTVPAVIYIDGNPSGTTTIQIDGKKTNYLRPDKPEHFSGKFAVAAYERTCRDNVNANIHWQPPSAHNQTFNAHLAYMQSGISFPMEYLLINEDMKEILFSFEDGIVITTSDEIYQQYCANN